MHKRGTYPPATPRRCVDLASDIISKEMQECAPGYAVDLLMRLPSDISEAEKVSCVDEFSAGVAGLKFTLMLKFSNWSLMPWSLYLCASSNLVVARQAMRSILGSRCTHPRIQDLQRGVVCEQADRFVGGEDLLDENGEAKHEMQDLLYILGACRYAWSLEWLGESEHAKTRKGDRRLVVDCV